MTAKNQPSEPTPARRRAPLLALGGVALVTGLWGGLARLGLQLPLPSPALVSDHGVLMVCAFLGTLIGVERAVALGRWWAYAAPLLTGLGGIAILVAARAMLGVGAVVVGSAIFLASSIVVAFQQPASFTITMAVGAAAWVLGNGLWWTGRPVFSFVWWWAAFLLLTIAGERLELSRLMPRPKWATASFFVACALFLLGVSSATWWPATGARIAGAGAVAVALWLVLYDLARRTVRQTGLPRYVAVCLLSGYAWLMFAGATLIAYGRLTAGAEYDAALHAFFVGFVFSMIFGHAPIIFPAVLRIDVPYRPVFYLPLVLLHGSLTVRVAGDLYGLPDVRLIGGVLNAVAIIAFIASVVWSTSHASSPRAGGDGLAT